MRVPINDIDGVCPTVLAGYFKFGTATILGDNYGTTGAAVLEIYEIPDK